MRQQQQWRALLPLHGTAAESGAPRAVQPSSLRKYPATEPRTLICHPGNLPECGGKLGKDARSSLSGCGAQEHRAKTERKRKV